MKTNILTLITIATAIFLTSCEKEIEFNGEQTDPKLVINSLIEPGQPVKARISKSLFFLDNEGNTDAPEDLVATLYVNGNRIGEMTPCVDSIWNDFVYDDEGNPSPTYSLITYYISTYNVTEDDVVKITASANGFDDVEGSTSPLPNRMVWRPTNIETLSWDVMYYDYEGDTSWYISSKMELSLEITDPNPGKMDYFKLRVDVGGFTDEETGCRFYINTTYNDPIFGGTSSEYDDYNIDLLSRPEGVFTDVLFDGKSYTIKLPLIIDIDYYGDALPDSFQLPIQMAHLSKEYYYYLHTCSQGDEISQFFSEPVQTYSNVNGGYGIVGGRMSDTLEVTIPLSE